LPFGKGTDRDAWGKTITKEAASAGDAAREKILGGWNPFQGEIKDKAGAVKVAAGESMDDTALYHWNWSVEGVSGL